MRAWLVVGVLASGCFISPVMRFGPGKTAPQAQREVMDRVTPPALLVEDEWEGAVHTAKVRVWADDDYRAQNMRWQQTFETLLEQANEILAAQFGVRLVAEYRVWNTRSTGHTLDGALAALAVTDPGEGVLVVIGLTSSLSNVSVSFEQLGFAATPGRHLVIRGYADVGERAMFERAFSDLRKDERETLYAARRRHKTVALLLHELGHNFGAQHRGETNTLMNSTYSHQSSSFDASNRATILATLDLRLNRPARATPSTPAPQDASHPTLEILIDSQGQRIVGGNLVDDATLDGLLRLSFTDDPETAITVRLKGLPPQHIVIQVIDRAKAIGLRRVTIRRD